MLLTLFIVFVWSILSSVFAIPSIINLSHSKNLLDIPNHRTVHLNLTPRLGGLAIFVGWISAVTIFGKINMTIQHLIAGAIIIFFLGAKDDIESVPAVKKFFLQFLAACIVLFIGDIRITSLQGVLGIYVLPIGISYVLTFLIILGLTNAINLIDGINGLAGSIILVCSGSFSYYFYLQQDPMAFVGVALVGSVSGFLYFNFKSKIFMGDTGSLLSGFILSIMAIRFIELNAFRSSQAISISIVIIPLFDTIRVFALRILNGQSPFHPDKRHIHHRLMELGLSPTMVVCTLVSFNVSLIIAVTKFSYLGSLKLLILIVVFCLVLNGILSLLLYKQSKSIVHEKK